MTEPHHSLAEAIQRVVAAEDFGKPTAQKRGRNPKWPYVPVVIHNVTDNTDGRHLGTRQEQIVGKAFETRDEAVDYAARVIARRRELLAADLATRGARSLREKYGLPRELPAMDALGALLASTMVDDDEDRCEAGLADYR